MNEIKLSIMDYNQDSVANIIPWLRAFEAENHIHVEVFGMNWETAWPEMVKTSYSGQSADVAEVGTTWISALFGMNALRPFLPHELESLGGPSTYIPALWQSGCLQNQVWAVPWLASTRVIYYRKDLLKQAGIEEQSAFQTPEMMKQTLNRLAERDIACPFAISTHNNHDILHDIASWVWNAGGEFVSDDGTHLLFGNATVRKGMRAYFELYRYLMPAAQLLDEHEHLFWDGYAAVAQSGAWLLSEIREHAGAESEIAANTGVALLPGVPFTSGSHLVIWKHSRSPQLALKLIQYLNRLPTLAGYAPQRRLLPARLDVMDEPLYANDPGYVTMAQALKTGRTFPQAPLWMQIQNRLLTTLSNIWEDIFADTNPDLDAILSKHLEPLQSRLAVTFENYYTK